MRVIIIATNLTLPNINIGSVYSLGEIKNGIKINKNSPVVQLSTVVKK